MATDKKAKKAKTSKRKATASVASAGLALVAVVALLAAYALGSAGRSDATADKPTTPSTMVLTGRGTATGVPDQLEFTLGVSAKRDDVASAMTDSSRTMRSTLAALRRYGVARKDVQTTGLSINPVYDYSGNQPVLTGYSVNQRARVTVPDLKKAGAAMSAAASTGGNAVRIHSVSLVIGNRDKLLEQARRAAVADATTKAREYAAAAGQQLGAVVSLTEVHAPAPKPQTANLRALYAASDQRSAMVPIRAGRQGLDVRVRIVWSLG
ncbi:SIMPL domain-containing protein [Nocardioides terrisoli]|uniref:SIMPL domain-containing protein n=1 Tax=Nocardioides terrisoli TaxID=3388267 RepID=UPI00287BC7F4|nr:SIMPL domain-containing protein [Nocardioides marmorisolisilvae]